MLYSVGRMPSVRKTLRVILNTAQTGHSGYNPSTQDGGAKQEDPNFKASLD